MRKMYRRFMNFLARIFIRSSIKHAKHCAGCEKEAIKILVDTPFVVCVCEDHIDLGNAEIKRAKVKAYREMGATEKQIETLLK